MKQHPDVTIKVDLRPGGTEGDNIVKTRLATGAMDAIFWYNSGSLLQALHPDQTLVDLSGQPFMNNVVDSFKQAVSQGSAVYGVPTQTGMAGGILYNKAVFAKLGLQVPKTWDELVANNKKIAAAGITPVAASFAAGNTWTAQLFVLADYYNVHMAEPGFAQKYTENKINIATDPAALAGFQHLQQGHDLGWWQKDAATATYNDALKLLATGQAAQYPMLTFALSEIQKDFPNDVNNIGFFAQPGTDAAKNGATMWMPAATYLPKSTTGAKRQAALSFIAFIASSEGTDVITKAVTPNGPYFVKGAKLPDDVLPAVKDIQAYIDSGDSYPALEFLSPLKGPNLEQICVAVATGQMTAEQGAKNYELDLQRQAQQLNLPGW
jgi:raffinose/stachyose/melibiose transport system substrate-binding protein